MTKRIGIVVGSIREQRVGLSIGQWLADLAEGREGGVEYELIDLKEFNVPLFSDAATPMTAGKRYGDKRVQAWSAEIDACDGFVFVTPEYNRSLPGAFKNAYDSLGPEWQGKPIAFVGYGYSSGIRAIEAWRTVVVNYSMPQLRTQLELSLSTDVNEEGFAPADSKYAKAQNLLAELEDALGA